MKAIKRYFGTGTILILLCCFLLGCQSTPDKKPVAFRGDILQKVQEASSNYEKYEYESTWVENVKMENKCFSIDIDCSIEVPNTKVFSVKLVTPLAFEKERIIELVNHFALDCNLYADPYEMSKEQLEKRLIQVSRGELIDGQYIITDEMQDYIDGLKKKIVQTPENLDRYYLSLDSIISDDFCVGAELQNGNNAVLTLENMSDDSYKSWFGFTTGNAVQTEELLRTQGLSIEGVSIEEKEAITCTEKVIADLEIKNFYLASIQKGQMYSIDNTEIQAKGYYLRYMRKNGELETIDIGDGAVINSNAEPEYSAPWAQEKIDFLVDENGIQMFYWSGLSKVSKTISENVRLMPFEELKDRIKKQLEYKYSWLNDNISCININVNRIVLGATLINIKDHPDEGLLVPSWFIIYDEKNSIQTDEFVYTDALVLNAIDGSIIEPRVTLVTQ